MTMRIPRATYRLQFSYAFRFGDAEALVPYLDSLGISDIYASPLFGAQKQSSHGYDVTDYGLLNPEIGAEDEFLSLSRALRERGMSLVLDVVPNHMGIFDESNAWWQDVLENGPSSPFAKYFDIDWKPPKTDLADKVLLPILGDQFGRVVDRGEISLAFEGGVFRIRYHDRTFPVAPRSKIFILGRVLDRARRSGRAGDEALVELESIITGLQHLPPRTETDPERVRERLREKEVAKRRLLSLLESSAPVREALDRVIQEINGRPGAPESLDTLARILAEQAYRLSFWRVATEEINYRRFFDVGHLAAVRVEIPEVFEAVHALPLRLVAGGDLRGLRIDHPDGLFAPVNYFREMQRRVRLAFAAEGRAAGGGEGVDPLWVVVEKILVGDETLNPDWDVSGTTGYEYLNLVNGLFVDPLGARRIRAFWSRLTGSATDFEDLVYECKKLILDVSMVGELHVLARKLDRISEQHRWSQDFALWSLQRALAEVIACFPVYRTYVSPDDDQVTGENRRHVEFAVREATRRNPAMSASIFQFIGQVLLLEHPHGLSEEEKEERRDFLLRFQQFTGPVMAKGIEDTAFYRWYPLASLNEVGGKPDEPGVTIEVFHRRNIERRRAWPHSMLCTSTHDTKRSEDVRARLNVLSEIPVEWSHVVRRWRRVNRRARVRVAGAEVPDANDEYLIYQTLVGIWPLDPGAAGDVRERLQAYIVKALREGKRHTSWINPNEEYERAIVEFIGSLFPPSEESAFWDDFASFLRMIETAGACNSLSQVLLKATGPGVPDFYQGQELWDFSLVDPDNRRPVDYASRQRALAALLDAETGAWPDLVRELVRSWRDGRIKMWVTCRALRCRHESEALFRDGDYLPLDAEGAARGRVVASARRRESEAAIVAVPRLSLQHAPRGEFPIGEAAWGDTSLVLPEGFPVRWRSLLTGEEIEAAAGGITGRSLSLAGLFSILPVALLQPR
jgi:(1->4)-alpha-D-glucan 1-alpha-D-glucosylmutase